MRPTQRHRSFQAFVIAFRIDNAELITMLAKAFENCPACGVPADPRQTVIIGDTPLDIAVAVAGGTRSIGVATGYHDADALRAAGADVVFEDLSDTAAVLSAITA